MDWSFQSHQCEQELLTFPDSNFHLLILIKGTLFLSILILPIFYGNSNCTTQFSSVSGLWKLRTNALVTEQTEWKRKMHLALQQLKGSTILTRHYSLYHTLGLTLDFISLLISCLYSLHFIDSPLPHLWSQGRRGITPFFSATKTLCQNNTFHCEMPNLALYRWFGLLGSLLLAVKVTNQILCLGFSLGIPGLFGRRVLLHCARLTDTNRECLYSIESRPLTVALAVLGNLATLLMLRPLRCLVGFLDFYFYNYDCKTALTFRAEDESSLGALDMGDHTLGSEADFLTAAMAVTASSPVSLGDTRQRPLPESGLQNWADLFFVLDTMSGSIDICEILIFISKTDGLVKEMEEKKVDLGKSQLDVSSHSLTLAFTTVGSIELLLEQELCGGLEVRGWLEGPRGRCQPEPNKGGKQLLFSVDLGTSYDLVTAVFARGRQLVRLPDYKLSLPCEVRPKLRKRHGNIIPLAALVQTETR